MNTKQIAGLIALVAAFILITSSAYTVDVRQQAIVTRLGKIKKSVTQPGLHFKMPFLDKVHKFSKMMLASDPAKVDQIYTADKKILLLDNYAIWQIVDAEAYLKAFPGGERYAEARLGEVIFSALRQQLGRHTQDEAVVHEREVIMDSVTTISDRAMRQMGIRVADVRIKRADLPRENTRSVYGRMIAERQREATRYRSNGEREGGRIRAEADRDAQVTLARAQERAQQLRGRGDSQALDTYARAYNRDRRFYEFTRSLQAYESALDSQTVMVLSSKNPFLQRFFQGTR